MTTDSKEPTAEQQEPSARAWELARTYVMTQIPVAKTLVATQLPAPISALLDWESIMEPAVEVYARGMSEEELERSIAWIESPLCKRLMSLSGQTQAAIARGIASKMREAMQGE